jgi:GTPase SAR1 family protein
MSIQITEKPNKKIKLSGVKMNTNHPIPNNEGTPFPNYGFCLGVCGVPNSGKTSLIISQMTNSGGLFYKKFHRIYIFSPSLHSIEKEIHLPDEQIFDTFSIEALESIIEAQKEAINSEEGMDEVLIIFDDMIADIMKTNSKDIIKMVLNRRHLHLSLIFTTQVFNKIPLFLRKNFSDIILFRTTNTRELETVRDELTQLNRQEYVQLIKFAFEKQHDFLMFSNTGKIYRNLNELQINYD